MSSFYNKLNKFHKEVEAAREDAQARLGGARRVKLGDLNLRDEFYREMKPLWRQIYHNKKLRLKYSNRHSDTGRRTRYLLLVFMSELVYWEYERSFWRILYDLFELRGQRDQGRAYRWLRDQMERGYEENSIDLIWSGRNEFVQTIVNESGFSRQLVQQAKEFVLWFFDHHATLDPRMLDRETFENIVKNYSDYAWDKDNLALLRDMVGSVNRLLREIRKNSLTSSDLQHPEHLAELEAALGFHPIRGIFGFRKEEDIHELLENLTLRMKPTAFLNTLHLKILSGGGQLEVVTPKGKRIEAKEVRDVPIMFGHYRLRSTGSQAYQNEIQVVPREALTLDKLNSLLRKKKRKFHEAQNNDVFIHDDKYFEVYQGSTEAEKPLPCHLATRTGYLWYGKRKIGIPLRAERKGRLISELTPRVDVWLNPRLRLNNEGDGLQVVIPSFVCFKPKLAGQTVRLELNERKIEHSTLPLPRDGLLQFQGTRVGKVEPDDSALKVRLVTLKERQTVESKTVRASLVEPLLFSKNNRELISPGTRTHGWNQFVLFVPQRSSIELGKAIHSESELSFGQFRVVHLRWKNQKEPFNLKAGGQSWRFERSFEAYTTIFCAPIQNAFQPQEVNCAFSSDKVKIRLHMQGSSQQLSQIKEKLTLIIEKDGEFLTDFSLRELERRGMLKGGANQQRRPFDLPAIIYYLIAQHLTDREVGSYRCTLMVRSDALADLESLSELDFMLLPSLQAHNTEQLMIEGQDASFTVQCNSPYLADEEDHGATKIQLTCTPDTYVEAETWRLQPKNVEKTIRLIYPPTKVRLNFQPNLFAMRLVNQGRVLPEKQLTYQDAQTTELLLLTPVGDSVSLFLLDTEKRRISDAKGHIRYPLSNLLPLIKDKQTTITVAWREIRQQINIIWYPSLNIRPEECRIEYRKEGKSVMILGLEANGAPNTTASFKVRYPIPPFPPRIESYSFTFSELNSGKIELPIDLQTLKKPQSLHCSAYIEGQSFGRVKLSLDQAISAQIIDFGLAMVQMNLKAEITRREIDIQAYGQTVTIRAVEDHVAFSPKNVKTSLHVKGSVEQLADIWDQLALRIEKKGKVLTDFSFSTLSEKRFLSHMPAADTILFDVPCILNELLAQGLIDSQIGRYYWHVISTADAEKSLSELDFMLLPHFRVRGLESSLIEGKMGSFTLSSDTPSFFFFVPSGHAFVKNKPAKQFDLFYRADVELKSGHLHAKVIEKTIDLLYPRAKITLRFQPNLFAMRLVNKGKASSNNQLTYQQAQSTEILLLIPPEDSVYLSLLGTEETATSQVTLMPHLDVRGQIRYPLSNLLPLIKDKETTITVAWREVRRKIKIIWNPSIKILPSKCSLEHRKEGKAVLFLGLKANAPSKTKASFQLFDHRFGLQHEQIFTLSALHEGHTELPVEIKYKKSAQILYCILFIEGESVALYKIRLGQTRPQVSQVKLAKELANIFKQVVNPKARLAILEALQQVIQPPLPAKVLYKLYSSSALVRLGDEYRCKKMNEKEIKTYLKYLTPSLLAKIDQFSIAQLKKCLKIPFTAIQLKCATELIKKNDCVGIEKIVELMADEEISWQDGLKVLSQHAKSTTKTIHDLIEWWYLLQKSKEHLDIMLKLCHQFAPKMASRVKRARNWKQLVILKQKRKILKTVAIGANAYKYGLIVSIGKKSINGEIPLEELERPHYGLNNSHAKDSYLANRVHQTIKAIIIEVDFDQGRVVLSEKQAKKQLADQLWQNVKIGDTYRGVVKRIHHTHGVFVDLGGVDGLIHASEFSRDGTKPNEVCSTGDKLRVYVRYVDPKRKRIGLSMKPIVPFSQKVKKYRVGQQVQGRVIRLEPYGAFVLLKEEVEGFIPLDELSNTTVKHPEEVVELGNMLDLCVLRVDYQKQNIILSLKQVGQKELYWRNIRIKR